MHERKLTGLGLNALGRVLNEKKNGFSIKCNSYLYKCSKTL